MAEKYVKVKLTEEEIAWLKRRAELHGKKLNAFLRECALEENPVEIFFDREKFEVHTDEISKLREVLKGIIFTHFEDKILLSEQIKNIEKMVFDMEVSETKLRSDVRKIRKALERKEAEKSHGNDQS